MTSKKLTLARGKTLAFLESLSASPDEVFQTLYLPPRLIITELEKVFAKLTPSVNITSNLLDITVRSDNGTVILWGKHQKYLVVPPFPLVEKSTAYSLDIAPLQSLLNQDYYIGVVLVRLGSYAVGICRGEKLIGSKVGTGLVHGRHRQGGSSSHRFERHRDKQIESFLIRVCGHVREQLEPYVKSMDFIVYGGARTTILMLQKYCPLLWKLDKSILPPLLDIPAPRQSVLESAVSRVWSSAIYDWTED